MSGYQKRLNKAAVKKAVTWNTEIDVNAAGNGITPNNQGAIKLNYPAIEVDEITSPHETDIEHANYGATDFPLDFNYNFDGLENILEAMIFGTAATPEPLFVVTTSNNKIDFNDGSVCVGSVAAGSYTGTTLATAIAAAMNAAVGKTLTFTCTWSSSTLKFTIAHTLATPNFIIMWNTGSNKATDISTLCGFSDAADDTGGYTYTSDTVAAGSGAYSHSLLCADATAGIFGTYAVEKGTKIHVVPSFKPQKLTLGINSGLIKMTVNNRGTKVIDNSAIVTSLGSVTCPAIHNTTRAKYHQAVFLLNAQTGDALSGSTDKVYPKSYSIEFDRKLDNEHGASSATIVEPLENGKTSVKVTLEFSRMDAANELYFAQWVAETEKKMSLTITGPVIAGTHTYSKVYLFPRLAVEDVEYADAGMIPAKIVMRGLVADSAPTGMTVTTPISATLINTRATSLLA